MAYINKTDVKAIRDSLKRSYPAYKFGVRKGSTSTSVEVTIKEGPTDFSDIYRSLDNHYEPINQYHLVNYGVHRHFFRDIMDIIKTAPRDLGGKEWYDNTNSQIDHFDTAYYINLAVGQWDTPYVCTNESEI